MQSLDLSGCPALTYVSCKSNNLTSLNLSGSNSVSYLNCRNNSLRKEIDDYYDNINEFYYDRRFTDYSWEYEYDAQGDYKRDDEGNPIRNLVYTDNGVGWWYPGEPESGYHGKKQ